MLRFLKARPAIVRPEKEKEEKRVPQDQTAKRRNIASQAVIHATAAYDALLALRNLSAERAIAGNFVEADFDGTDLVHLTPFMIGALLDTHAPDVIDFLEGEASRKNIFLEVRRGG